MTTTPKELLDSCLEIEGLLALIIQRDNQVPSHLYGLISERTESLLSRLRELNPEVGKRPAFPPIPQENQPETTEYTAIADSTQGEEIADADGSLEISDSVAESLNVEETKEEDAIDPQQPEPELTDNESEEHVTCDISDTTENCNTTDNYSILTQPESTYDVEPVIKKVKFNFSVNDRFRFRRELFNFNDEEMDDALDVAAQMSTLDELEAYFYDDLCMDPEDETVQDFINIISKHLK